MLSPPPYARCTPIDGWDPDGVVIGGSQWVGFQDYMSLGQGAV